MLKSTLLELLRTFSEEELEKFDMFLRSPYFNRTANAIKFFSMIRKHAPDFESDDLKKEAVWKALFPGKQYNYGSMKNLIHLLTKLALKFIAQEISEKKPITANCDIIKSLITRRAENLLLQKFNEAERMYTRDTLRDKGAFSSDEFYYYTGDIYTNKYFHQISSRLNSPDETTLMKASTYHVCSYLICLTKNYNNILVASYGKNTEKIRNPMALIMKEMQAGIIDKLMPLIKDVSERDYRVLDLFMKVNKAQLNPGKLEYYKDFVRSLKECAELLPDKDIKGVMVCRSVLLSFLSDDEINVNSEALEIAKVMTKYRFFESAKGQLQAFAYYFYIQSALMLNEFDEIRVFSKKYLSGISGDMAENAINFTGAVLAFCDKKFDECLGHISKLNFNYFMMKVEIKELKAKCLFELDDYLLFESEHKSLYHFLKNNKSLSPKAHQYLKTNFEMIAKFFRLREKFDSREYDLLKEKIMKSETYKNSWFAEKIKSIK